MKHIDGGSKLTYLAGSHQLLSFGVFIKRSVPSDPIRGSVKRGDYVHEIPSDDIIPLDPARDHKVAEVCRVPVSPPSGGLNDTMCVLADGFNNTVGSSFDWAGRMLVAPWDGKEYFAFDEGSSAIVFRDHQFQLVYPCYSYQNYTASDGEQTFKFVSGIPHYIVEASNMVLKQCDLAWITNGEDIRSMCLKETEKEPTPRQAYVAAHAGFTNRYDFFDYYFGCAHVMNASHEVLKHTFIEAEEPIAVRLKFDGSNGMFFHTENQQTWIDSSLRGQELLKLYEFIDRHTRVFEVFLLTRDLAEDSLFYSLLRVEFKLKANGAVSFRYQSSFSPILHYTYGIDEFKWKFREVLICEVMFLLLFAFFVYREVNQLIFNRIVPGMKYLRGSNVPIAPAAEDGKVLCENEANMKSDSLNSHNSFKSECVGEMQKSDDVCEFSSQSNLNTATERGGIQFPEYQKLDDDKIVTSMNEVSSSPTHSVRLRKIRRNMSYSLTWRVDDDCADDEETLRLKSERLLERRARAQLPVLKRLKSAVANVDLNNNGISDVDEIKEIIEDFLLPDQNGWHDILDWITIITILVAIYYRSLYVRLCLEIHDFFLESDNEQNFNHLMEGMINDMEHLDLIVRDMRVILLVVIVIGLAQFFRYLSFDRRFGIVTDTILTSFRDLIPVLIIFSVVCVCYAVMGTAIYGQDLIAFQNIGASMSSLFLMILGQFDGYYEMAAIAQSITVLYFWSFVVIAYFILFNMVLAVIFTTYDEEYDGLKQEVKIEAEKLKKIESFNNEANNRDENTTKKDKRFVYKLS